MTAATHESEMPREARALGRRARELATFAERKGLDDELEAVREALRAIWRKQRDTEHEAETEAPA